MDLQSTLRWGLVVLVVFLGWAHSKCQTNERCHNLYEQTTGRCIPLGVAMEEDNRKHCPKEGAQICEIDSCFCCKTCKTTGCNERDGFTCMSKSIAAASTWFDYTKDCEVSEKLCEKWSGDPNQEECLCCPERPPMQDSCLDVGCFHQFDGHGGMCVNTSKPGWNLNPDIDLAAPMKTGFCWSKNQNGQDCCGCFKQMPCQPDSKVCKSSKKISRECSKEKDAPINYFWTGKTCNKMTDCKCFQKCKQTKKCTKINGRCLRALKTTPDGWIKHGYCDKKTKKCMCYTSDEW